MPIARFEVLVLVLGTVARNVHWILFPLTLPFTEFTLCWREKKKTDNREDDEFSSATSILDIFFPVTNPHLLHCQRVIVEDSAKELDNTVFVCTHIGCVISSLWGKTVNSK